MATVATLNNKGGLEYKSGKFAKLGDPTETALKVAAEKLGRYDSRVSVDKNDYTQVPCPLSVALTQRCKQIGVLEFSSERKTMSTVINGLGLSSSGKNSLLLKGAPERVIEKCTSYKN